MKFVDLAQNSPEWLEWRTDKIGASDAPVIMGVSPYRTASQLYLSKTTKAIEDQNPAMRRGQAMEAEARQVFNDLYGTLNFCEVSCVPYVVQSDEYPWMIASLDGLDHVAGILVEIKCPGQVDHDIALSGCVPDHYIPQLQHQMYVTGLDKAFYFSYRPGQPHKILTVTRDDDYCRKMIEAEQAFLACLLSGTPPGLDSRDYYERCDQYWVYLANEYVEMSARLEELTKDTQNVKDQLIKLCNGKNCIGSGVKITHSYRKGTIDYAKIESLKGLDLEPYRRQGTAYSVVTLC